MPNNNKALTTIELLLALAVVFLMFGALMASVTFNIKLATTNKGKLGATAIMNQEIESIRSMKYSDVGTVSGVPVGNLQSVNNTIFNGVNYTVNRYVYWVDDSKDGVGAGDSDGNPNDYKQVRIKVSWSLRGETKNIESFTYVYGN